MTRLFKKAPAPMAVRTIELSQPLRPMTDVMGYRRVRIYVSQDSRMLGSIDIDNNCQPISLSRISQAISELFALKLMDFDASLSDSTRWASAVATLAERYLPDKDTFISSADHFVSSNGLTPPAPLWIVDLSQPLGPLTDVTAHEQVQVLITWQKQKLGVLSIHNQNQPVSESRLRKAIVDKLGLKLLEPTRRLSQNILWSMLSTALLQRFSPDETTAVVDSERLPASVRVSIVVATYDRPDDLRQCLQSLVTQLSSREIEIIVVDNHPSSGLTPSIVGEFPGVRLVNEPRQGLAYARNAGFVASTGDIVIATDDDVIAPPNWLEQLVAPFARQDVMIVTGNVLPLELETPAQQYFELYGGLGRGFERWEANTGWFEAFRLSSVPTWKLGATANAAFRASIFAQEYIGLMDESLGPGMPSGVGEDTYLFYKVLKAGYTIIYEPQAYVWHKHRRTMKALRKQLYNYSKGGVAYHLTLWLKDGDWRGLFRIFVELPLTYIWRLKQWRYGRNGYPPSMMLLEMAGNLAGFWALWQSWQRVKREGHSSPYVPVPERKGCVKSLPPVKELTESYISATSAG